MNYSKPTNNKIPFFAFINEQLLCPVCRDIMLKSERILNSNYMIFVECSCRKATQIKNL